MVTVASRKDALIETLMACTLNSANTQTLKKNS
jgi:hypothetical protein